MSGNPATQTETSATDKTVICHGITPDTEEKEKRVDSKVYLTLLVF